MFNIFYFDLHLNEKSNCYFTIYCSNCEANEKSLEKIFKHTFKNCNFIINGVDEENNYYFCIKNMKSERNIYLTIFIYC